MEGQFNIEAEACSPKDDDMPTSSEDEPTASPNTMTGGVPTATTVHLELIDDSTSASANKFTVEEEDVNRTVVIETVRAGGKEITQASHVSFPDKVVQQSEILAACYGSEAVRVDERATSTILVQEDDEEDNGGGDLNVGAENDVEEAGDKISLATTEPMNGHGVVTILSLPLDKADNPVADANDTPTETGIPDTGSDNNLEEAGDRIFPPTSELKNSHREEATNASLSSDASGSNNSAEASITPSLAAEPVNSEPDDTNKLQETDPLKVHASGRTCMSFETASSFDSLEKEQPLDEEAALGKSEKTTDSNLPNNNPIRRRFLAVATLGCLILAVALPLAFVVGGSLASTSDEEEEESYSVASGELVPDMMQSTFDSMRNPFSPQTRAYEWIASDPNWDTYEDWRKQQRFAMACLFYSFSTRFPLFYEKHECDWRYRRQVVLCTTDGHVRGLSWTEMMWTELHFHIDSFLPAELALLPLLERLDFSGSTFRVRLDGEYTHVELDSLLPTHIPSALSALRNLKATGCTGLQGSIPSELGLFTSLTRLDLGDNELTSTIPTEVGLLTGLQRLDLRGNALTATLPSELGSLNDLGALWVQDNDLSSTIPVQLGELPLLTVFVAEDNDLERALPPGFCETGPMAQLVTDWCWSTEMCCY